MDVIQSDPGTMKGSLGVAQLQVDTARGDQLVDLPAGSHRTGRARSWTHTSEVEMLLTRMATNPAKPGPISHSFTASGPVGDAIHTRTGASSSMSREGRFADAACGACNSPDVIAASNTTTFTNAAIHGSNANLLAQDLFRFRLCRAT